MRRFWAIASLLAAGPAAADSLTFAPGSGDSIDESMQPVVAVERLRTTMVYAPVEPSRVLPAVNSNVIFLNRCAAGCTVRPGNPDSIADTWMINATSVIQPFAHGTTAWDQVVSCVRSVFSPFNVQITDIDPGTAPHFEIMVAGSPQNIGLPSNVGGIAPFDCGSSFIPNALVFAFAN